MTLGELIRELAADEQCYERNQREAERIRAEKGPIAARWNYVAADLVRRERTGDEDGIELLCNEKFGAKLSHGNALKLRGELARQHGLELKAIDALSLEDVETRFRAKSESNAAGEPSDCNRPKSSEWWATQPPGEGWYDKTLIGTKKKLAHCVGVAFHGKHIDEKTLATMHSKSVWICRVNRTTWQAYFRDMKTYSAANCEMLKVQTGGQVGAKGNKRDQTG